MDDVSKPIQPPGGASGTAVRRRGLSTASFDSYYSTASTHSEGGQEYFDALEVLRERRQRSGTILSQPIAEESVVPGDETAAEAQADRSSSSSSSRRSIQVDAPPATDAGPSEAEALARDVAVFEQMTEGVVLGEASHLDATEQSLYLQDLLASRKTGGEARTSVVELTMKAAASGLSFGLIQEMLLKGADAIIKHHHITDELAKASIVTAVVALPLAVSVWAADVVMRTAGVSAIGGNLVPTDPVKAFPTGTPDYVQRRLTMKGQQAATKPGHPVADIVTVTSQAVTSGIFATAGVDPALGSMLGGAFTGLGLTLVNLATSVPTADGRRVPSHWIPDALAQDQRSSRMDRVATAVTKAVAPSLAATDSDGKAIRGKGPLLNLAQELLFVRPIGVAQGVALKHLAKSKTELDMGTGGERFGGGAIGPIALLGAGYFPNTGAQGLASDRGNTDGLGASTIKSLKAMDPRRSPGTTEAVAESISNETARQIAKVVGWVTDGGHQIASSWLRVPASLASDVLQTFVDVASLPVALMSTSSPARSSPERDVEAAAA